MPGSASRPVHRRNRQGPPRRALLTSSLAGALLLPMLTVPPAYAAPSGTPDIPADPADWASAPYSPLAPESLDAGGGRDGAVELTFDGKGAGLPAADGRGTGFTAVLPSSEASPYFVPERLLLSEGKLKIAAGNGSAARGRNDLDNALGVPLAAQEDTLRLSTVRAGPVGFAAAAEGGIWFGGSDRNFVTLSLAGSGSEARQVKLTKETGDAFRSPADGATESKDQVIAAARQSGPAEPVRLTLDIDPWDRSVAGSYQIGDGKAVALGPLRLPAGFLDGT
ncbi:hypothetical protein HER39_07835, partial [Arthrobacter deserti]|nr:hypothetical protein [Arthrobacter deserti]